MSKNPRTTKPTTIGGIPKPPSRLDTETKRYLETLAEAIEVRLGRRGDTVIAVTLRELIDSGLAKELLDSPFDPNNPGGNITSPTIFKVMFLMNTPLHLQVLMLLVAMKQ